MFLKHLHSLYADKSGVAVKIRNGNGGSPKRLVAKARREPGDFEKRIVILDNDKSPKEMLEARAEATKIGVAILENTPCLEATLLSILNPNQNFSAKKSKWYKKEFEKNYISPQKRTEPEEYKKIFAKKTLDQQQKRVSELKRLINLIQGTE